MEYINLLLEEHAVFFRNLKVTNPELVSSVKRYTGSAYKEINKALRDYQGGLSSEILFTSEKDKTDFKNIEEVFRRIKPIEQSIITYRGVTSKEFVYYSDKAFISTSREPQFFYTGLSGCCMLVCSIPIGAKVLCLESISNYPAEHEILLERNGTFQLTSFKEKNPEMHGRDTFYFSFLPPTSVPILPSEFPLLNEFVQQDRKQSEDTGRQKRKRETNDDEEHNSNLLDLINSKITQMHFKIYDIQEGPLSSDELQMMEMIHKLFKKFTKLSSKTSSPSFVKKAQKLLNQVNELEPIVEGFLLKSQADHK